MNQDDRKAALAEIAEVDIKTRAVMLLVARGLCPFCLGDMNRKSPLLRAIDRGITGDALRTAIVDAAKKDAADGIDSMSGHYLDCGLTAAMNTLAGKP